MNVLSLFDGISCGRVALERAGITVEKYYASEIDTHAMKISGKNYPDIIQLGDIKNWREWDIDFKSIDILFAGFPCQAWSLIGKQGGDTDPRGELVHHLIGVWKKIKRYNPKLIFLFENVKMKKGFVEYINQLFECKPILINSNLVSAQNRERYYWTNIAEVTQPENKNVFIEDILEDPTKIPVTKNHGNLIYKPYKSQCLDANYWKGADNHAQRTGCIEVGHAVINGHDFLKRVYGIGGKAPTLTAVCGGNQERKIAVDASHWRKLTPIECERLQTLEDNYTEGISNSQRYKCIGNGWTVDVIAHILSFIPKEKI